MLPAVIALFAWVISSAGSVAPPSLEKLAKQYEHYGLPPADPELRFARITTLSRAASTTSEHPMSSVSYAFVRVRGMAPGVRGLIDGLDEPESIDRDAVVQWLDPKHPVDESVLPRGEVSWFVAIRAHQLGHRALAASLLTMASDEPVGEELRRFARNHWFDRLRDPKVPRCEVIKHLRAIDADAKAAGDSVRYHDWIDALERSDQASTSTDRHDRLIEALVDSVWQPPDHGGFHRDPKIRAVLREGFDIVPALIRHLDNARPTRQWFSQPATGREPPQLVGQLCGDLLQGMAVGQFFLRLGEPDEPFMIRKWTPHVFEAWWKETRSIGEKSSLDRLIADVTREHGQTNARLPAIPLTFLQLRHPARFRQYFSWIANRANSDSELFDVLASSTLSIVEQQSLLRDHLEKNGEPNLPCWHALSRIDRNWYRREIRDRISHLQQTQDEDADREMLIAMMNSTVPIAESKWLVSMIRTKPAEVQALWLQEWDNGWSVDENRTGGLLLAEAMLDDRSLVPHPLYHEPDSDRPLMVELRQQACEYLAEKFGHRLPHDFDRPADEWAMLRKWVRDELNRERGI